MDKDNTEELKIKVIAKNIDTRIEDTFTLMVDPELRATRLKNEKRLEEQRKLAKKRKQEEIERLKAEKILKEKQAQEEALELARKQAEETLRQEQEKIQLEKQQQEELLAKQKAEEQRLIEEQKELLNYYITSFVDNAVELKMFLNEELGRLKKEISSMPDDKLNGKAKQINEKLNSFNSTEINESTLLAVLKTQQIVKELNDGSNN